MLCQGHSSQTRNRQWSPCGGSPVSKRIVGDIPECSPMGRGQTERLFCVLGNLQKFSPSNRTENGVILGIYDPYVETLGRSKGVACREV